jgi:hypothetical protein
MFSLTDDGEGCASVGCWVGVWMAVVSMVFSVIWSASLRNGWLGAWENWLPLCLIQPVVLRLVVQKQPSAMAGYAQSAWLRMLLYRQEI